jgi:hypothetical protein
VSPHLLVYWVAVLEFLSFISLAILAIYVLVKIRASYGVFMITALTLSSLSGTFVSTPRYWLHLFPAFLALVAISEKRPFLRKSIFLTFLILGLILTSLFTRGYFVS